MKNIKYLAMFLAAAVLFVGCTDDDELSNQNQNKPKPTVTLTAGSVSDAEFSFTIAASESASQYAYAVFEGEDNTAPIAHDIVVDEVSGAYQTGAFNVADAESQTINVECKSATTYQIYAAAITSTGLLSEVVSLDIQVDDTIAPVAQSFDNEGSTVKITYSEPIKVGTTGSATVAYIQWVIGNITDPVAIPMENISTEGNVATIVCDNPGNGAGYIVNITEGLFEDLSGNKAAAINSGWQQDKGFIGLGWSTDYVEFPIEDSYFTAQTEDDDFNQPTATITLTFPFDVYDLELKNSVQVIYNEASGLSYMNSTFTLESDLRTVKVALPKVPTGSFDVQFAAGAFVDVWGNKSAAYTVSPDALRYSNYQVEIKTGLYSISYASGGDAVMNPNNGKPFSAYLEPYGDNEYILHADWFGMFGGFAMPDLVGTVDYATNQIVFDGRFLFNGSIYGASAFGMGFYNFDAEGKYSLVFWGGGMSGTDPITVKFDEDGYLTDISYCEYAIYDKASGSYLATYDFLSEGSMTFVPESTGGAGTAGAPSVDKVYKAFTTPLAGFAKK